MLLPMALLLRQCGGGVQLCRSTLALVGHAMRPLCELKQKSRLFSTPSQLHWKGRWDSNSIDRKLSKWPTHLRDDSRLPAHAVVADASLGWTLLGIAVLVLHSVTLEGLAAHITRLVLLRAVSRTAPPVRGIPLAVDPAGFGGGAQLGTMHLSANAIRFIHVHPALSGTRNIRLVDPRAALLLPLDALATLHRTL